MKFTLVWFSLGSGAAGEANDGFIGEVIVVVVEVGMLLCFSACTNPGRSVNKQQKSFEVQYNKQN